ncbi:MAG: NADH-quinone oxidoreductase subunit L [Candidatus Tectomicrobia bacterium]|nr:NADH-quinone oxidoreductase subunit L [Candidatus Tectomicrobia bacterium]
MLDLAWLMLALPLLGVFLNLFVTGRMSERGIGWLASAVVGLALLVAVGAFLALLKLPPQQRHIELNVYTWIASGSLSAGFGLLVDQLSIIMALVVTGVGFIIHVYSIGYMHGDPGFRRYFVYLNLFIFSMLILVLANNFLLLFVGWEGVGLCSYLLIGFWYERKSAADAGKKAFIVNRVGDFGFLLAIFLIFALFGSLDFTTVFSKAPQLVQSGVVSGAAITAITLLLFVGATGKSAQLPLYVWLPDAMEGPTPVSALIHAATMVTAGVYMVVRTSALFALAPLSLTVVAGIGLATAFFAATMGLVQTDIKRVLAYSTVSQLGYMFLACGVGAFTAAIFHLMTHAFFKSLLFLGSGSVIHALGGEQDLRRMGGLFSKLRTTGITFWIGALAIAGIFPFAGFFSKDEILWETLQESLFLWAVAAFTAFLTALYMFRLIYLTFHGPSRVSAERAAHIHESPKVMTRPLVVLAVLSILGGFVGLPLIQGGNLFKSFLEPVLARAPLAHGAAAAEAGHAAIGFELFMMIVSLAIAVAGLVMARRFFLQRPELAQRAAEVNAWLYRLLCGKYFVDEAYDLLVVRPVKQLGTILWRGFDVLVIDGIANGAADLIRGASGALRRLQTGYVKSYAVTMVLGAMLLVLYFVMR